MMRMSDLDELRTHLQTQVSRCDERMREMVSILDRTTDIAAEDLLMRASLEHTRWLHALQLLDDAVSGGILS